MYRFCAKTGAFYHHDLKNDYEKAGNWPEGGRDYSVEERNQFCNNIPPGKKIGADAQGNPVYVDMDAAELAEITSMHPLVLRRKLDQIRPLIDELKDRETEGLLTDRDKQRLAIATQYRRALLETDLNHVQPAWPDTPKNIWR